MALYATEKVKLIEHPRFSMLGRSGMEWVEPEREEMIPLPRGASLVSLPGQIPVACSGGSGEDVWHRMPMAGHVQAVAALLPQGFTRTLLPAM